MIKNTQLSVMCSILFSRSMSELPPWMRSWSSPSSQIQQENSFSIRLVSVNLERGGSQVEESVCSIGITLFAEHTYCLGWLLASRCGWSRPVSSLLPAGFSCRTRRPRGGPCSRSREEGAPRTPREPPLPLGSPRSPWPLPAVWFAAGVPCRTARGRAACPQHSLQPQRPEPLGGQHTPFPPAR